MPVRGHMHREPTQPSFVDRAVQGVETAGKLYAAGQTLYHIGRGVGTAMRMAAPLLAAL